MKTALRALIRNNEAAYRFYRAWRMRIFRWRYGLRHVHASAYIDTPCRLSPDLRAEEYVFIGRNAWLPPHVKICRYAMLAPEVAIVGADHRYDIPGVPTIFAGRFPHPETVIGADAWIGQRAIIMAGVTIGRGAIVAASAVVTKNVEPYEVVAGIPARTMGLRFKTEQERQQHEAMLLGELQAGKFAEVR